MIERRLLGYSEAGFHQLVYTEWGSRLLERAVICVHGVTRSSRDFDLLADTLKKYAYVVCPDLIGRGKSDWMTNPDLYHLPQYFADCTALIARLDVEDIDWIGTSLGGIIGMFLSSHPKTPIRRLVLNDLGPFIPKEVIRRLATYMTPSLPSFDSMSTLEAYVREIYPGFGPLTDTQWHTMALNSARRLENNRFTLNFDPGISKNYNFESIDDISMWEVWDRIPCPVLVLRGSKSDMLLAETAKEMMERGPKTEIVEIPECGHAPNLMNDAQIDIIRKFLFP